MYVFTLLFLYRISSNTLPIGTLKTWYSKDMGAGPLIALADCLLIAKAECLLIAKADCPMIARAENNERMAPVNKFLFPGAAHETLVGAWMILLSYIDSTLYCSTSIYIYF